MGNGPSELTFKQVLLTILIFCGLVLLFTVIGVLLAPPASQIGSTRPADTIPSHLLELAGFGLVLGGGSAVIYGRKGLPLVLLIPVLTVLLDLDHLPAYLGAAQTIRPAHSLIFIIAVLSVTAITIKRMDIDLAVLSAVLGHLGIDTGLFAPFAPISFEYVQLDPYMVPLLAGAIFAAVAAGVVVRRRRSTGPSPASGGFSDA